MIRLRPGRPYTTLARLASEVGWKYGDVVSTLEEKRKVKSAAYYEQKKKIAVRLRCAWSGLAAGSFLLWESKESIRSSMASRSGGDCTMGTQCLDAYPPSLRARAEAPSEGQGSRRREGRSLQPGSRQARLLDAGGVIGLVVITSDGLGFFPVLLLVGIQ